MARTRLYGTDADRQMAYRGRVETKRREVERIERERQAVLADQQRRLRRQADDMMVRAILNELSPGGYPQDAEAFSDDEKQVRNILLGYLEMFERGYRR